MSKFLVSAIGIGLILQGLIFYAFATTLTTQSFPGASDEAHHVGTIMRGSLASMSLIAGLVVFLVRQADNVTIKRVLFACAIGFGIACLLMINISTTKAAVVPIPALVIYMAVSIFSFYLAFQKS